MKIDHLVIAAALIAVAIGFAIPFGMAGVRVFLGLIIFFVLPGYLILRRFAFDEDERVFFAFFAGLGLYTAFVYFVGRVIPSFKVSVFVTLVVAVVFALSLSRIRIAMRRQLRRRSAEQTATGAHSKSQEVQDNN